MTTLTTYKVQDAESGDPLDPEDWTEVQADTPQKAAAIYCELRDKRDVQQWGDSPRYREAGCGQIRVRRPEGTCLEVKVRVYQTIEYYADTV